MSEQRPTTLMQTVQETVLRYGVDSLAEVLGKRPNTLYQEINPHPDEGRTHKLGLLDFRALTKETRDYAGLRRLCLDCDHVATPIPTAPPNDDKCWFARLGRLSREFGEVAAAVGDAMADGRMDRREARRVLHELDDLLQASVGTRMELRRILGED